MPAPRHRGAPACAWLQTGGYSGNFRPQFGQKAYSGPVFSPQ